MEDDKFRLLDTEAVSTGVKNFIENLFIVNFVIKTIAGIWDGVRQKLKGGIQEKEVESSMTGQTEDQPITSAVKREKAEQMQEMATGQVYPKPETVTENFVPSDENNNKENDAGGIQEKSVKVPKVSMDSLESFACPVTSFAGWDKVVPYRDFICISDVKTSDGEDIVVVDTSALPLEKSFKKMYRGKQLYRESMDAIFKFTNIFINNCVKSTKFSLLIYANDGSSIAPSGKCAKMFYKVLQEW
ncbi:uncharacterized protein [Montipora capricornis]|uniref:uncharacterized protein n=1 Tax=Montipora capricornis TaxID=246305 RepID=UPI0035F18FA7